MISIPTRRMTDLEEAAGIKGDDELIIHDGIGVKKIKMSNLVVLTAKEVEGGITEGDTNKNYYYRGANIGQEITPAQIAAIRDGSFADLAIGDYWLISGVTYRIAGFNYYYGYGNPLAPETFVTDPHVTIVPDAPIGASKRMNAAATAAGGYVGSEMRGNLGAQVAGGNLVDARLAINAAFPGLVMKHKVYLCNAIQGDFHFGGIWCDSDIELMNEIMVYGTSPRSDIPGGDAGMPGQLPLFMLKPGLIVTQPTAAWWWLRDVWSAALFSLVAAAGSVHRAGAGDAGGVRPAFSIS